MKNPFTEADINRHAIWEMLVERDIAAYCAGDWSMTGSDFQEQGFFGLHAHGQDNPDKWRLDFPNLAAYRDDWLRQAAESAKVNYTEPLNEAIHRAMSIGEIDLGDGVAVVRKKFDGRIRRSDGGEDILNWQSIFFCAKLIDQWKVTSFIGYLPNPMGGASARG